MTDSLGGLRRIRPSDINIVTLSDLSRDAGTLYHGNLIFGEEMGRRVGLSDEEQAIFAFDEFGRKYFSVSYVADYFRLGLPGEPAVTWTPEEGLRIDGHGIIDGTVEPKKLALDSGSMAYHLMMENMLVFGSWVITPQAMMGSGSDGAVTTLGWEGGIFQTPGLAPNEFALLEIRGGLVKLRYRYGVPQDKIPSLLFELYPDEVSVDSSRVRVYQGIANEVFFESEAGELPSIVLKQAGSSVPDAYYRGTGWRVSSGGASLVAGVGSYADSSSTWMAFFDVFGMQGGFIENFRSGAARLFRIVLDSDYAFQLLRSTDAYPAMSYSSGVIEFAAPVKCGVTFRVVNKTILNDNLTISANVSLCVVDTEGGAATDNLSTITATQDGHVLVIKTAASTRDVTLKDGIGNLYLAGDCLLDTDQDMIVLICLGENWYELARSNNA